MRIKMAKSKTYYIEFSEDRDLRRIEVLVAKNCVSLAQQHEGDVELYEQMHDLCAQLQELLDDLEKEIKDKITNPNAKRRIGSLNEKDFEIMLKGWKFSAEAVRPQEWDGAIKFIRQLKKINWEAQVEFDPEKKE